MKTLNLTKKQKIWIITGAVMAAIIIAMSVFMIVCVSRSIKDGTVPSGTTSLIGNFLRNKNKIEYEVFDDKAEFPVDDFRVSLSVMNHREDSTDIFNYGYTYTDGINTADDMRGLQQLYDYYGATEMYVRIATARYYPDESAEDYYHAKMHCLEESKKVCALAAELGMPINVELGCFAAYSDAFESQYPDFSECPEIDYPTDKNGNAKEWKDMELDEICSVLNQYGKLVAYEIKALGCEVEYRDLGNETNYGFGGVMMPLDRGDRSIGRDMLMFIQKR